MVQKRALALALWAAAVVGGMTPPLAAAAAPAPGTAPAAGVIERALAAVPVAAGAGLFQFREAESAAAAAAPSNPDSPFLTRRSAAVDAGYLQAMMAAADVEIGPAGEVSANAQAFVLNLAPDTALRVVKQQSITDELGNTVWTGVPVAATGAVTLVIHDGAVTGQVLVGGQQFGIIPTEAAAHAVVEYRPSGKLRRDDVVRRPGITVRPPARTQDAPAAKPAPSALERPGATPSISIYVAYTAAALKATPDMQGAIGLALADLRTTLANSQITAQVTLAGSALVNYVEGANTSSENVLNDAMIGAGDFARIRGLQKTTGGDILSVWSVYKDNCGLAGGLYPDYAPDEIDLAEAAYYQVNTIGTIADCGVDTFTHEVGHLLGANHERYIIPDSIPGPAGYNYGYVDLGRFRDVMAYGNECDDKNRPCPTIPYFSNPKVSYQGRPVGVADSSAAAADNARKITEVLPYAAQLHSNFSVPNVPVLTVTRVGNGTVTDNAGNLSCGTSCNAAIDSGTRDTLRAVADPGWDFSGWGGACSGTAASCTITISANTTVTATFTQSRTVQVSSVYSSIQPASQSFVRLYNTSTASGTATISLVNAATGSTLGRWTSPAIAPGVERQFAIQDIEAAATPAITTKPQFYTAVIESQFAGYVQHVLWHISDNTLTNLTTCSSGSLADPAQLMAVHSTLLGAGYPSSVVVYNAGTQSTRVTLGVYDALTGTRLGGFQTDPVAGRNGQRIYTVAAIEVGAGITPAANMFHYVIKPESTFTGHIAHLMQNVKVGVVTDMSTVCPLTSVAAVAATSNVRLGAIFSSAQPGSQSFLRVLNTGTNFGIASVTLTDPGTGNTLAVWNSANIPAGAGVQVPVTTLESAATGAFTKPDFYTIQVAGNLLGEVQHVLWHASDGTLTNLTTCYSGSRNNPSRLGAVHASGIGAAGYPSSIVVANTGKAAATVTLDIANAGDGAKLGSYRTASIPAGGQAILSVNDIETGATPKIDPAGKSHYVVTVASEFSGYLQHVVDNTRVGVVTDMTTTCGLQP